MFVQWCIKGIEGGPGGIDDAIAREIIDSGVGIQCNWWRNLPHHRLPTNEIPRRLTPENLSRHVNHYEAIRTETPFISVTAGSVERLPMLHTNKVNPAKKIALQFATRWGTVQGFLFYCWLIVGLKSAVEVEGVAEEVRELNTYRSYSDFQPEGEIAAKIRIPATQIRSYERYEPLQFEPSFAYENPRFEDPASVSNIRDLI